MLSENDKAQLRQMIEKNHVVDKTDQIRELKHSANIRKDILALLQLKQDHADLLRTDKEAFEKISVQTCHFLFFHYMELYNMILKESMELVVFDRLLEVLGRIERHERIYYERHFTHRHQYYSTGKFKRGSFRRSQSNPTGSFYHSYRLSHHF